MVKYTTVALGFLLVASAASAIPGTLDGSILNSPEVNHKGAPLQKKVTYQNYDEDSDDEATVVTAKIASKKSGATSGFRSFFASAWQKIVSIFSFR